MTISILSMTLRNFKGIEHFKLEPNGNSVEIRGENGAGKTSLMDAWTWLLFGKDAEYNQADNDLKPTDRSTGDDKHHLETSVEAVLSVGGRPTTIKRTLSEKWTTKRGMNVKKFTGNETSYMINGVPKKAKEWDEWRDSIIDEKTFMLLSNPLYMNMKMPWKERRNLLLSLISSDDISEVKIARGDKKYSSVVDLLAEYGLDEARTKIAYQIKQLEKERKEITPRIDELTRSVAGISQDDVAAAEKAIADGQKAIKAIDTTIESAQGSLKGISELNAQILAIESDKSRLKREAELAANKDRLDMLDELTLKQRQLRQLNIQRATLDGELQSIDARIKAVTSSLTDLRKQYETAYSATFVPADMDECCPTCGQVLPQEQIEDTRQTLKTLFEENKRAKLSAIDETGKLKKQELDALLTNQVELQQEHNQNVRDLQIIREDIETLEEFEDMPEVVVKVDTSTEDAKIADIQAKLDSYTVTDVSDLRQRRQEHEQLIAAQQRIVARGQQLDDAKKRIGELQEQERRIGEQLAGLEGQKFALEELVAEKCRLSESTIDALFSHTIR